jgi:hypothetical protein
LITLIIANIFLSINNSKKIAPNSIRDFIVLKHFNVSLHHLNALVVKEIMWQTPLIYWLKCNIDGVAKRNSCHAFFG